MKLKSQLAPATRFALAFLLMQFVNMVSLGASCLAEGPPAVQIRLHSKTLLGLPISWNDQEIMLLERTGRIVEIKPVDVIDHSIQRESFLSHSAMQLRGPLLEEFGRSYAVDGSGDFVIVSSPTTVATWTMTFANLQRSFTQYFATRGYPLRKPSFPLVGIVFKDQASFFRHAATEQVQLHPRTAGFYSILTNRLYLYEPSGNVAEQQESMATICHEATHQLAFNCGLHQRLSNPPLWAIEGLASIFEAPGLLATRSNVSPSQLLNAARIQEWNSLAQSPDSLAASWENLLQDDRLFKSDPDRAYAVAWGMSLYFSERQSTKYNNYLQRLDRLTPRIEYTAAERTKDVKSNFPGQSAMHVQNAIRYIEQISN